MARLLAQSVAAELDTQRVLASVGVAGDSRYVLRGRAERNRDNNRVPFIVVIKWDLVDASSKLVCNHSQGVEGTWWQWEYGDPRIIRSVGKVAAKPIVAMIRVEPDTVPPGAPQPANLLIEEVKGAPGDGNSALTREMKVAAKAAGVNVFGQRLLAFVISAFFCGMAGGLFGHFLGMLTVDSFHLKMTFL